MTAPPEPSAAPSGGDVVQALDMRSRMSLHLVDLKAMPAGRQSIVMQPGLSLTLVLSGGEGVTHRPEGREADALAVPGAGPAAILMNFAEPHRIDRHAASSSAIRHVGVTIPPDWLQDAGLGDDDVARSLQRFGRRHLAMRRQRATMRTTLLAEQLFQAPRYQGFLQQLLQEGRALELLASMLDDSFGGAGDQRPARGMTPSVVKRLHRVRELIEQPSAASLALPDLARHAGMSTSQLQERFKALFGMTVFEMMRHRRMERARAALEAGMRVGQAAVLAGYSSQANFSTAFRKRYGIAPKLLR